MCRLFGLNAGHRAVHVDYWLQRAPDSVTQQSHRNPDGTGVGWFGVDGGHHLHKRPDPAWSDPVFAAEAGDIRARTLITHIRAATTGANSVVNCHPFWVGGLMMAHNGGFGDLPTVERELGDDMRLVHGQTDSERFAALIARFTRESQGDVAAGITRAAQWLAEHVPLYSLNCLVATAGHLWALRYPDQRALHVTRRTIDAESGDSASWTGRAHHSEHRVTAPGSAGVTEVVIVASERLDAGTDWRMLEAGELLHVGPDLTITSSLALTGPPANLHLPEGPDPNVDSD